MSEIEIIRKALHDELCSECQGRNCLDPCPDSTITKNWNSIALAVRNDLRRAGYLRRRIAPDDESGTDWAKVARELLQQDNKVQLWEQLRKELGA